MPKPILKKAHLLLLTALCLVAIIINSCKKDAHTDQQDTISPAIAQAKSWYENAYPVSNKQASQATTTGVDLSQLIKPDWQHTSSYKRGDQPVMEIPIDPSAKFAPSLKNMTTNSIVYSKDNSRSSFLLLKDGEQYNAYIMTVIADAAYLKNDMTKLDHNKYNKRDTDFSGVVLYSTPKGTFVSGWFYKNGSIIHTLQPNSSTATGDGQKVQSLHPDLAQVNCTDWYQYSEVDGTVTDVKYLGATCDYSGGSGDNSGSGGAPSGSGGGGGSAGSTPSKPTPPPPCTGTNSNTLKVQSTDGHLVVYKNVVQPPPGDGDGTFPPPTTPPPPPPSTPCTITIPVPTIIDSLGKKYPCTKALIVALPNLNTNIANLIYQAFSTNTSNDIIFLEGDPAHFTGTDADEDGYTNTDKVNGALISSVYINPFVLANSSNEYRLVTLYHEALHAFLNSEHTTLGDAAFASKYPMINVFPRQNFSQVVNADKYDYYIDPAYQTKIVGKDHLTMADYFVNGLRDAILAYNPSFPSDRALALAQTGIIQTKTDLFKNYNDAERDVTKGNSVGHKCSP